jgi:alanyl-tRNA synthetase
VQKPVPELIVAHLKPKKGILKVGDEVQQRVHNETRALTARNHTATHLLQWALKKVLGDHVKQAGSLVTPELLRFDFSHFQAMTADELLQVENLINSKIWSSDGVKKQVMKKDEAIAAGAVAMFGEKYGDVVRVISVGDYSTELCGGTHVETSGDIHLFKVASEAGIAAGVRRIIAYTSKGAFEYLRAQDQKLKGVRDLLKASTVDEIPNKIDRVFAESLDLRKQVEKLQSAQQGGEIEELFAKARSVGPYRWVGGLVQDSSDGMKKLREMADKIKQQEPNAIIVLGVKEPESQKPFLVAAMGAQVKGVSAGDVIKASAAKFGGKGGGKPDFAQAGGTDAAGLADAITTAREFVEKALNGK